MKSTSSRRTILSTFVVLGTLLCLSMLVSCATSQEKPSNGQTEFKQVAQIPDAVKKDLSNPQFKDDGEYVKLGDVPSTWTGYALTLLDRQGVNSMQHVSEYDDYVEFWVPELFLRLALTVLSLDSEQNNYDFKSDPTISIELLSDNRVSPEVWSKFRWIHQVESELGIYRVEIEIEDYRPFEHEIARDDEDEIATIDGKTVYGVGMLVPTERVSNLRFFVSGKRVEVSSELWSDCYSPNVSNSPQSLTNYLHVTEVAGGLDVVLSCADGWVGYEVTWKLRANGNHSREFFVP